MLPIVTASSMLLASAVHGQGLLAIGQNTDYPEDIPLTFNVSVGGGFDRIEYDTIDAEDVDSYFLQGGVNMVYGKNGHTTNYNIGLNLNAIHYLDGAEREDDLFYNAGASFNITHEVSRRMTVSDNFYFTYEIEPDYGVGVTAGRRAGQYVYGFNNVSIAYAWTERLSTTSGYTIDGIRYVDNDEIAQFEDRLSHTLSQQVSYALTRKTKLTGEYRFKYTNYDTPGRVNGERLANPDYTSHYALVGVDQAWNERTSASFRAGAEFYQSDRADDVAPYAEGSLNYALTRRTNVRLYGQVGYDASELGLYDSRYSYRTGVVASHQISERLRGNAGVHYVYSDFNGNDLVPSSNESQVNATLGFSYNFWHNLSLDANYSYTTIASDLEYREYERHRLSLALNATF